MRAKQRIQAEALAGIQGREMVFWISVEVVELVRVAGFGYMLKVKPTAFADTLDGWVRKKVKDNSKVWV